jgi:glyoxylate/hydroxypyruvate reductase A
MTGRRLLFAVADGDFSAWESAFRETAPDLTLVEDAEGRMGSGIRYCLAWKPKRGLPGRMPDLALLFALGAGVERFLADPELPPNLPVVKMAEPGLTREMTQYVLWQTINHHRRFWELEIARREARWIDQLYPAPWERKVGILGLGTLGTAVAVTLRDYGFDVRGWSRGRKEIRGVACFAGAEQRDAFLAGLEILICLLPLTQETSGILNADLFRHLAPGAALINVARGGHLNESDLLAALDGGQLSAASLDVTAVEPLPPGHPFWQHPRIFLTPHHAADIDPATGAREIKRQIDRFEAGLPVERVADRALGY